MKDRYEVALERARKKLEEVVLPETVAANLLYDIFPELAESEDERVIKWIASYIHRGVFDEEEHPKALKAIEWLEKQKAKERLDRMAPIYNDKESFESALEKAWKYYNESASRKVDSFEDDYIECVFSKGFREGFLYKEKQKENPKTADSIPSDCTSDAKCEDRWHKVGDSLPDNGRLVLAQDCLGNTLLARYDGEGNWEVSVYDKDDYYCRNTITKWCEIPSEKQKEHQNNSDAPNESSWSGIISSSGKDKNLDEIAQDYVDGVKEYNPEPTWDLMQTAVCYGYHYREQKERGPLTKEEEYILHRIIEYLEDETCPSEWISLLHDIYCLPYEKQKEQKPSGNPKWTELTWKDIVELEGIINNVHYDFSAGIGQESFGKEVLERFRNKKEDAEVDACEQKPLDIAPNQFDGITYGMQGHSTEKSTEKEIILTNFEETLNTFLFNFTNSPIEDCEPKEYIKKYSAEILKAAYKELNAKLKQDIFEAQQEGRREGYEAAKAEANRKSVRKEQNPTDYNEYKMLIDGAKEEGKVEGRKEVIDHPEEYGLTKKPAEKQDYSGLTDLERVIYRGFIAAGVENASVTIIKETAKECVAQMKPVDYDHEMWKNCEVNFEGGMKEVINNPEKYGLCKPAEWDDYTKTNLDRALQIIKNAKGKLQGYQSDDGIYECDKAIECLEHFLYRGLEIEKIVEWSEDDKRMIDYVWDSLTLLRVEIIKDGEPKGPDAEILKQIEEEKKWLKSLRPQPQITEDDKHQAEVAIAFLKDYADKGYENAVCCIDWLKHKYYGS